MKRKPLVMTQRQRLLHHIELLEEAEMYTHTLEILREKLANLIEDYPTCSEDLFEAISTK